MTVAGTATWSRLISIYRSLLRVSPLCHITRWGLMLIRWQRFFSEDAMANPVAWFIAAILFACVCCFGTQSIADGQSYKGGAAPAP